MHTPNLSKESIIEAFQYRHACKEFDISKSVSDEDFKFILNTANLSPSSFGFEPWHFIVVKDAALRESLKPVAWGAPVKLDTASHFVLGLTMKAPKTRWDADHVAYMINEIKQMPEEGAKMYRQFYKEFQERDFDLDTDRQLFDWASKQSYIPLANMMTAAAMIGVDSCPIEGFHQQKTEALLKDKFDVDTDQYGLSYMVAFGYRKQAPAHPKTRRPIEDIVTWK